jgi:Flp pilus assembly pilin Flp
MLKSLKRLWNDQSGQDLAEYVLLFLLVALGTVATTKKFAQTLSNTYTGTSNKVAAINPGGGSGGSGGGGDEGKGKGGGGGDEGKGKGGGGGDEGKGKGKD